MASKIDEYRASEEFVKVRRGMNASMLYQLRVVKPADVKSEFAPFHYELQDMVQNKDATFSDTIIPRRHAKTTILSRGAPIWHAFEEDRFYGANYEPLSNVKSRWPAPKHIVLSSRTEDGSKDDLDWIKDVLNSQPFKVHYGEWGEGHHLEWTKHRIVLKNGTCIRIKGMGQQFVGLNYRGLRPTFEVLNDMEDETNTGSDHQLNQNAKWLAKSVEPSLDNDGRLLLVGTPKNRNCLVERCARPGTGYKTIRYAAILNENQPDEQALWESWLSLEWLKKDRERARAKGQLSAWYMEWMCTVRTDSGDFNNLQFWEGNEKFDREGRVYLEVTHTGGPSTEGNLELMQRHSPPLIIPVNCYLGADPAIGTRARSDPSVVYVRGYDKQKRSYGVHLWYKKGASVKETAEEIVVSGLRYQVKHAAVETTAYQDALRQRVMEMLQEKDEFLPGINSKNNPRKKKKGDNSRLSSMQPDYALGRGFVRASHTKHRDEALDYPDGEDHVLDAEYYSRLKSWPPMHTSDMLYGEAKRNNVVREKKGEMRRKRAQRLRGNSGVKEGRKWMQWK